MTLTYLCIRIKNMISYSPRTLGWNGGDGVLTTLLPDGHVFWSFNDSFYGVVNPENRARGDAVFLETV